MSTVVTPSPDTLPASITIPDNGDLADAATVGDSDTKLLNLGYFLLKRLQHTQGAIRARCDGSFGTPDEKTIRVYPILGFVVIDTAVRFGFVAANTDIDESDLEGGGNYANNTFYYVYIYISAGTPTFQISTTAPDSYRMFKSGGTTHKFLFSFLTNGIGEIKRFYHENGLHIHYSEEVISTTSPTVAATVSLSSYKPPHSKIVVVKSTLDNSAGAAGNLYIGPTPTDVAGTFGRNIYVGPQSMNGDTYELPLSENHEFDHFVTAGTTSHQIAAIGWRE